MAFTANWIAQKIDEVDIMPHTITQPLSLRVCSHICDMRSLLKVTFGVHMKILKSVSTCLKALVI